MEFKIIDNILSRLGTTSISKARTEALNQIKAEMKKDNGKRLTVNLTHYRTFKAEMQQDELRKAIEFAQDPERPDREILYAIYKEAMRDPHLLSQIRTNILKVIGSPFAVFKQGTDEIHEDATNLLLKPWFSRLRYIFHETPYWGHTLVQFEQMVSPSRPNGMTQEFRKISIVPREHVKPESGQLIRKLGDERGFPFREEPFNFWFLEIGDSHDLGLLNILSREVIWKNYSRTDWSRYGEKFGMPTLLIKTASRKDEEIDEMEKMAKEFGSNLWMFIDDEDDFDVQWPKNSDGHTIFKDKADFCDAQVSKLVAGQESTSSQKAFVGSAEVHERILNEYMEEAMRNETFFNNDELFPFLIKHGYPLDGLEFRYLTFTKEEEKEGAKTEDKDDPPEPTKPTKKPGKTTANFTKPIPVAIGMGETGTLTQRINSLYQSDCCNGEIEPIGIDTPNAVDLDTAVNKAIKKVYDRKLRAGGIDQEVFWHWAADLWNATLKGYDVKLDKLKYGSNDHIILNQLRHNVHVFAAFKNHHHVNELVKALVDDDGNTRSFSKFKEATGLINTKYNKNWLKTEHTQAILTARNAKRWQKIESRKHIFPNVEYVVVNDRRLSQICEDLAGGIWSVNDPILDRISPSNHFKCRSFLKSTKKGIAKKNTGEEIQPMFNNNPGKSGEVFTKEHPYYTVKGEHKQVAKNIFGVGSRLPISKEQLASNIKALNKLDQKRYGTINVFPQSGGWMAIHNLADKNDLAKNKKAADILARSGYTVEIRRHVDDGRTNPEFLINGVLSDLKTPGKPYSLDNLLKKAVQKQGLNNVVYEVIGKPNLKDVAMGLKRGFHNRSNIDWIDLIFQSSVVRITRKMFESGVILKQLEGLN